MSNYILVSKLKPYNYACLTKLPRTKEESTESGRGRLTWVYQMYGRPTYVNIFHQDRATANRITVIHTFLFLWRCE
jgi:hypothetical protein